MNKRLLPAALAVMALVGASGTASALTITRSYIPSGGSFSGGLGNATAAPTLAGTGNLVDIFNAAADLWEIAIQDAHALSIQFGWQGLSAGTLGVHVLGTQGGTPHREISAVIRFDSDGSSNFFADPTPKDNAEYTTLTQTTADLGGGVMNTGRVWTGATGFAATNYDLFTVAVHEIGHALGMSSANTAFLAERAGDSDIDVEAPRPFPGAVIPLFTNAHMALSLPTTLMYPYVSTGERNWISVADILANAEVSEFNNLNLDPQFPGEQPVPEPATLLLLGGGLAALALRRRRQM